MRARRLPTTGALALLALLWGTASPAQSFRTPSTQAPSGGTQLTTQVSAREVEVGESIVVSVTALSTQDGPSPANPKLPVEGSAEVHGPSLRSEFRMFADGRSVQRQQGVTATWTVTPTQPGTLVLGPGTFQVGSQVVSGERVTVRVVPASGTPRRSSPGPRRGRAWPDPFDFDPFDWLQRRSPPGMDPDTLPDLLEPRVPAELRMDRAPDPVGFARMEAVPQRVVLGEQVTLRIYAYGGRGPFNVSFVTQPGTADFLSFPIEQHDLVPHRVPIGGQVFHAAKLREVALVPLKLGELTIEGVQLSFSGRGYPATGAQGGFLARSQPVTVTVVEPPLAGRPPGYVLGDVGRFELEASVEPRQVKQGDFLAVTARLKGSGNLPSRITPAESQAVDWHEPVVSGGVEALGTTLGGERVFRWTVRANEAGKLDLGELRLPYYDPERRRYETARAALGTIEVLPNPTAKPAEVEPDAAASSSSADVLTPRRELGAFPEAQARWTDRDGFWWALFGVPLAVPALGLAERGARTLRGRRRGGAGGTGELKSLLASAASERRSGDLPAATRSFERALYLAIELATGLKARGLLRSELEASLAAQGFGEERAREISGVIGELEAARFTGASGDPRDLEELTSRTERLVKDLLGAARKGRRSA